MSAELTAAKLIRLETLPTAQHLPSARQQHWAAEPVPLHCAAPEAAAAWQALPFLKHRLCLPPALTEHIRVSYAT